MSFKEYPPIKSWILIGFIAIGLFIICDLFATKYGDLANVEKRKVQATHLLKNSLNSIKSSPQKIQVVAIGSSLVGDGIACTSEYGNQYSNVELTKLYLNSENEILKIYDAIGAFDSLLIYPPDILLIQIDQLAYNFEKSNFYEQFLRGAFFLNNLNDFISKKSDKYKLPKYCGRIIKGSIADTSLFEYKKMLLASFDDRKYLHHKLKTLSKRGVKIYLVHVPRPTITESILPMNSQTQKFTQLTNEYHKLIHSTYIQYPENFNFRYFYDFAHLNNIGRKKYSDWLYSKILGPQK